MLNHLLPLAQMTVPSNDPWTNSLLGLDQDQRFVILIIGISCATAIVITTVSILAGMYHTTRRRSLDAQLKRDMLDRGMSAEEIAMVIESATPDGWAASQSKT